MISASVAGSLWQYLPVATIPVAVVRIPAFGLINLDDQADLEGSEKGDSLGKEARP
jgi:hypothetical protein